MYAFGDAHELRRHQRLHELRRRAAACSCRRAARATGSRPATARSSPSATPTKLGFPATVGGPTDRVCSTPKLSRVATSIAATSATIARHHTHGELGGTGLRGWHAHDAPRHRPLEPAPGNAGGGRDARDTRARSCSRAAIPSSRSCARCCPTTRSSSRPIRACIRRRRSGCTSTTSSAISTPPIPPRSIAAVAAGAVVERHPADKDATDLELAFDVARDRGARAHHGRRRRRRPARPLPRQRRAARVAAVRRPRDRRAARRRVRRGRAGRPAAARDHAAAPAIARHAAAGGRRRVRHHDHRPASTRCTARRCGRARRAASATCSSASRRSVVLEHGTLLVDPSLRRCAVKRAAHCGRDRRGRRSRPRAAAAAKHAAAPRARPPSTTAPEDHDGHGCSRTARSRRRRTCSPTSPKQTGYKVKLVQPGDAGVMVNEAILRKDNPVADALFGVDNTFLTRALDAGIFDPYVAPTASTRCPPTLQVDPQHRVTPIDEGDVCVDYDKSWFGHDGRPPAPTSLDDLIDPALQEPDGRRERVDVVARARVPARDDRGEGRERLAARTGRALRHNGVRVDDDWTAAYETDFTAGGGSGDRPIVVSYGSDPAGRRRVLEPAPRHAATSVSSRRRASARWSSRACCTARTTCRARRRSSTSCCRGGSRTTCRCRCT